MCSAYTLCHESILVPPEHKVGVRIKGYDLEF